MSDLMQVSPYGGCTVRVAITDCTGAFVSPSEISRIQYSIYREFLGNRTGIQNHIGVQVSTDCLLETPMESIDTGMYFNFEHRISAIQTFPFPEYGQKYVVVYTFYDSDGEPHPCEFPCWTGN